MTHLDRLRVVVSLTIISVLLTGLIALLSHPWDPDSFCCDHLFYRSMSYNLFTVTRPDLNIPPPGNRLALVYEIPDYSWLSPRNGLNRQPPYVYRVLTPLLARVIAYATSINAAYYLISFLGLVGASVFIGLAIYELTGSQIPAAGGAVLFLANPWSASFNLHDYMLTDPMAFFLTAVAIWALVTRKRAIFFAVCAVGVLNKESMVPLVLAYPLTEWWLDHRVHWSSIVAAVLVLVGWYLFRLAIPIPVNTYSFFGEFRGGLEHVKLMFLAVLATFAGVVPAAVMRTRRSRLIVALVPFAIACILEAWFVDNLERVMVQALPAICLMVLWRWPAERRQQALTLAAVPFALAAALIVQRGLSSYLLFAPFLAAVAAEVLLVLQEHPQGTNRESVHLQPLP